ncbi:MAG: class I SAM-dependent methyltransferase [bacterium]
MIKQLVNLLCDPYSKERLQLFAFKEEFNSALNDEEVVDGLLIGINTSSIYPIINGVPIFLPNSIDSAFVQLYEKEIGAVKNKVPGLLIAITEKEEEFSFSLEWQEHQNKKLTTTWGMKTEERYEQFFIETQTNEAWCKDKLLLDAGCGNGLLSEYLTRSGATVIGFDYSTSIFAAHARKMTSHVQFIRGDLQHPPFNEETFDVIISNGVLHHTPDTYKTFVEVARLVKPNGKFYLWLYRKPDTFFKRYILYGWHDTKRFIISRLPSRIMHLSVALYTLGHVLLNRLKGVNRDLSYHDIFIMEYDHLTPRWRHYHTPLELCYWFYLNGFSVPILTSWDWDGGFGMLAVKEIQRETSGINFGKSKDKRNYTFFR